MPGVFLSISLSVCMLATSCSLEADVRIIRKIFITDLSVNKK